MARRSTGHREARLDADIGTLLQCDGWLARRAGSGLTTLRRLRFMAGQREHSRQHDRVGACSLHNHLVTYDVET
jgi:hypothetical protein